MSLAPLRSFHQRSSRVRALIWGGTISATDVTPFPGQSSFQRRGCVLYVIFEERRGHWTAPGVETLLTLSRQNSLPRASILGVFFLSIAPFLPLFFPFPLPFDSFRTQTTPCVIPFSASSLRFFFPFPLNPRIYPLSILSVSLFLRFVYYYPRHRNPYQDEPLPTTTFPLPSLSFSRLIRYVSTFLCANSFPYVRIPFVQYRVYNRADRGVCLST